MNYVKDPMTPLIMKSIADGHAAYIDQGISINTYGVTMCTNFKNVKLKMATQTFFLAEQGMAFRKGFDQNFKRTINKL